LAGSLQINDRDTDELTEASNGVVDLIRAGNLDACRCHSKPVAIC
jgi:hypothetical protein